MAEYSVNSKRIAKNTFLLYVRMILVTLINLYTVRVVLDVLGVEDYGIYNVVAGVVSSLSFLTSVMSSATQRFYSFSIGESRTDKLREVFNVSMICYMCLALLIVLIGETLGLWFVKTQLTIPSDRMYAAIMAYQFSIVSFVFTALQVPFSSLTIAKEDMNIWSIISIVETLLKMLFAFLLPYIAIDHLISYGASLSIIWLLALFAYVFICRRKYSDICVLNFKLYNYKLLKEMASFSGWTMYGTLAVVGLNQGITILINLFFGPIINAARAVGMQINSAIGQFCQSFTTAIKPPIVKCYASNIIEKIVVLFYFSNKVLYYSTLIFCLPLFMEMEFILNLWLKEVSDYMIIFSKYSVIFAIIASLHTPVTIIIEATGNIRRYRVLVESFTLLSMPLTWIVYKMGFQPESTYIVVILIFSIAQIIRVRILSQNIPGITTLQYFSKFVIGAIPITIIAYVALNLIQGILPYGFIRLAIMLFTSVFVILLLTYLLGLDKHEKKLFIRVLRYGKKAL